MNWTPIISAVIGLLAPYAAKAGEAAAKKLGEDIYAKLKERFRREEDESAERALESYVAEPDVYEEALAKVLTRKAEAQPDDFGALLRQWAGQAGRGGGTGGQVAIGSNIAQADRGSSASVTATQDK
jgi:hypothetical protein